VTFAVDDDELAVGPGLMDAPRAVEGTAEVEPSVDEPSGYPGQSICVSDDLILGEP
jgi:hypothetical protein